MSTKSHPFLISVKFVSNGNANAYRFDALIEEEDKHATWLYLAPRKVPEERKGCVTISFDHRPSRQSLRDGEGRQAVLQSLYFDGRCSAYDDPPLESKQGTRAMLLGALHIFRHLMKQFWPHVDELVLSDQSTFKCAPKFQNKIRTFVTDLLTGDLMYYERHIGAKLTSSVNRSRRASIRKRILSPIDTGGREFLKEMRGLGQNKWLSMNGDEIVALLDAMKNAGSTWQDFFVEIKRRFGCEMYACCSEQLSTFFKMNALMGAEYKVKLDALKGTSVVDSEDMDNIRATIQVGGGSDRIPNTINIRNIRKQIQIIKTYLLKSRSSQYVGGFDAM